MKNLLIFLLIITTYISVSAQDRVSENVRTTRSEVIAQNGMAATSQPLCTQVALDVLKSGGSAVDAAIAANACLGLMEPTGNGIGGDLFAIIWDPKTKDLHGLNASGRSPEKLTKEWFLDNGYSSIPSHGALPVSVPGCVDGWFEMHQKFGKMDMKEVLQAAINYAEKGFPVSELIAYYMQRHEKLSVYPNFAEVFMKDGKMPVKGQIFKNPALAKTLTKIANEGRDVFYKGEMAKTIASHVQEQGGFLTYEDLASHKSEWIKPVSSNYRGYDVWELPPNGQGIAALQILNIMEAYDVKSMGFGSAEYIHHFTEAKKLAFEDRAQYYADPEFNKIPVDWLISKDYAAKRQRLIDSEKAASKVDAGKLQTGETIYMTVADGDGMMVSLIQSNYRGMGSGITPPGLGFVLQDRGELFALEDGHFNMLEPSKRPFHTIIPAFITKDGKPFMSFGLMGGAMQPQGHAQIVMNIVDFGMNIQEAGDAPRISHAGSSQPTGEKMIDSGWLSLESGIDYQEIKALMEKGHKVRFSNGIYGGYQAIMWDDKHKVYFGASESRKDGQAAGY